MKMKLPPIDPNVIIYDQQQEIQELKEKIYELMVDNEYLRLKLADTQRPEERRSGLSLMPFDSVGLTQ